MMNYVGNRVGDFVKTMKAALPQNLTSAPISTDGIEVLDLDSAVLSVALGAATGSPTGIAVKCELEHATKSDFSDAENFVSNLIQCHVVGNLATNSTTADFPVSLRGAKKYVRAKITATFTGGTNPSVLASGFWIVSPRQKPATPQIK